MRSSPIYGAGGKAVHVKGSQLQCGVLQTDIINPNLTEKCSFKVIHGEERARVSKEREGVEKADKEQEGTASADTGEEKKMEQEESSGGEVAHIGLSLVPPSFPPLSLTLIRS